MDSITRYLIITLLIVVFLVLSPLIVFYVTGRTLPFLDPAPTNTGILDVQTEPDNAVVLLNGDEVGTTPATIRFVKQGWHDVTVTRNGYRPWQKQLFIQSGEVTYAGTIDDAIQLLPDEPANLVAEQVTAFGSSANRLLYAQGANITYYDLSGKEVIRSGPVPNSITQLAPTSKQKYWLAKLSDGSQALFDTDQWVLSPLPTTITTSKYLEFLNDNTIVGLQDGVLRSWTFGTNQTQDLLKQVTGFLIKDNLFYIGTANQSGAELATYILESGGLRKQLVLLDSGLPTSEIELYLTNQKDLFLLADNSFFRVNQKLELLKNSVLNVRLNPHTQRLTFFTPTEIYFYNFFSGRAELLARTTEPLAAAEVLPDFGYGFLASEKGSEAVEIDSRGNQNRYQLFDQGSVTDMVISQNQEEVILLSNQSLYTLPIQ